MKRLSCVFAVLFGLLMVATQFALADAILHRPETAKVAVRVGGFGLGLGSFSVTDQDLYNIYGGGGRFGVELSIPMGGWADFRVGTSIYSARKSASNGFGDAESSMRIVPVTFTWTLNLADKDTGLIPYVGGGVGLYFHKFFTKASLFGEEFDATLKGNDFGYYGLFGFELGIATAFFCEFQYEKVEAKIGDSDEITDLGGTTIRAGFRFYNRSKK